MTRRDISPPYRVPLSARGDDTPKPTGMRDCLLIAGLIVASFALGAAMMHKTSVAVAVELMETTK